MLSAQPRTRHITKAIDNRAEHSNSKWIKRWVRQGRSVFFRWVNDDAKGEYEEPLTKKDINRALERPPYLAVRLDAPSAPVAVPYFPPVGYKYNLPRNRLSAPSTESVTTSATDATPASLNNSSDAMETTSTDTTTPTPTPTTTIDTTTTTTTTTTIIPPPPAAAAEEKEGEGGGGGGGDVALQAEMNTGAPIALSPSKKAREAEPAESFPVEGRTETPAVAAQGGRTKRTFTEIEDDFHNNDNGDNDDDEEEDEEEEEKQKKQGDDDEERRVGEAGGATDEALENRDAKRAKTEGGVGADGDVMVSLRDLVPHAAIVEETPPPSRNEGETATVAENEQNLEA